MLDASVKRRDHLVVRGNVTLWSPYVCRSPLTCAEQCPKMPRADAQHEASSRVRSFIRDLSFRAADAAAHHG